MFIGRRRIFFAGLLGIMLSGCTTNQVIERSINFNEALEVSTNRLMLLNVVRASKRYPMHFSNISQLTASPNVKASLGVSLPFGGGTNNEYAASPELTISQENNIVLVPLNDQDFYRGILEPVGFDLIHQYASQGWPADLLFYMFVEALDFSPARTRALLGNALLTCNSAGSKEACGALVEASCRMISEGECEALRGDLTASSNPEKFYQIARNIHNKFRKKFGNYRIRNDPDNINEFSSFQIIGATLLILDVDLGLGNTVEFKTAKRTVTFGSKDQKETTKDEQNPTAAKVLALRLAIPEKLMGESSPSAAVLREIAALCDNVEDANRARTMLKNASASCEIHFREAGTEEIGNNALQIPNTQAPNAIRTWLRSPQGMLFYLGEILNEQSNPAIFKATSWLFRVDRGLSENAAVTVQHKGEFYSIPSGREGRGSMQVLSLIHQIFNLKKKGVTLPLVPTVISTGN